MMVAQINSEILVMRMVEHLVPLNNAAICVCPVAQFFIGVPHYIVLQPLHTPMGGMWCFFQ